MGRRRRIQRIAARCRASRASFTISPVDARCAHAGRPLRHSGTRRRTGSVAGCRAGAYAGLHTQRRSHRLRPGLLRPHPGRPARTQPQLHQPWHRLGHGRPEQRRSRACTARPKTGRYSYRQRLAHAGSGNLKRRVAAQGPDCRCLQHTRHRGTFISRSIRAEHVYCPALARPAAFSGQAADKSPW